jgi:tetratricopeptide (TPR) repeat protein
MKAAALLLGVGVAVLGGCSADATAARGQAALERYDLAAAEADFRAALARDPAHAGALAGLGWTYQLAGQHAAAAASFERCAEVAPASAECLRGQASAALVAGNLALAESRIGAARALAPDDPRVDNTRGLILLAAGDTAAAEAVFSGLADRFPEAAEYRVGLAESRIRQGKGDAALEAARAGLATAGDALRVRTVLLLLQARALVLVVSAHEDPTRCAETAPPLRAWLDAAAASVQAASETGVPVPDLSHVQRLVTRRRADLDARCPPGGDPFAPAASGGK